MTAAELRVTREFLGMSIPWIAERLVLSQRRMQRMETGQEEIPQALVTYLDSASAAADDLVGRLSAEYRRKVKAAGGANVSAPTYRTDAVYAAAGGHYGSMWHRMCLARVAQAVPGLVLVWSDQVR